jgi:ABC-2 type transport system permease protein
MCYFFFDGLFSLGSYAQFGKLDLIIKYLSLSYHYEAINKGVLIAGDLMYCLSLIVLFLSASLLVIKSLKK